MHQEDLRPAFGLGVCPSSAFLFDRFAKFSRVERPMEVCSLSREGMFHLYPVITTWLRFSISVPHSIGLLAVDFPVSEMTGFPRSVHIQNDVGPVIRGSLCVWR